MPMMVAMLERVAVDYVFLLRFRGDWPASSSVSDESSDAEDGDVNIYLKA